MWIKTRVGYQYIYYTRSESIKSREKDTIRSTTDSCRQSWHRLSEEWTLPLRIELPYREGRLLRIWIDFENYLNGRTHLRVDGSNGKESSRVWGERTMGPSSSVHASGWEKHPIIIFYQKLIEIAPRSLHPDTREVGIRTSLESPENDVCWTNSEPENHLQQ